MIEQSNTPEQKTVYYRNNALPPFCIVVFGGTGDLSRQKLLPTLFHLYKLQQFPDIFFIISIGRKPFDDSDYQNFVQKNINRDSNEKSNQFLNHIYYEQGDINSKTTYTALEKKIEACTAKAGLKKINIIFYFAVPPQFFSIITQNIYQCKLNKPKWNARVIIEKPFGHNKKTAIELNNVLLSVFREEQVYRIDHYLGKETVQNIIFFRFSNSIFEPLWNRRYIDNIQITVAEEIGIGSRGNFYEEAGVIRDIIQNHMLQLIALIAMEPPVSFEPDYIRNEKVKVFKSLRKMDLKAIAENTVRGQYGPSQIAENKILGYREEENVHKRSNTPTFFAGKIHIDNWRWSGVPFYVRAGKRLPKRVTQIIIQFKQPPLCLFDVLKNQLEPSALILTIHPTESITLRYSVKLPNSNNEIRTVNMNFCYEEEFAIPRYPAYSKLLLDCMHGDVTLFVRQDGIEAMWDFIDPIIEQWEASTCPIFPNYTAGSWGPITADSLLQKSGHTWITEPSLCNAT